jgi:hypothetical protein
MRAPYLPKDDANTGPLVSFARGGIAAHWQEHRRARRTNASGLEERVRNHLKLVSNIILAIMRPGA